MEFDRQGNVEGQQPRESLPSNMDQDLLDCLNLIGAITTMMLIHNPHLAEKTIYTDEENTFNLAEFHQQFQERTEFAMIQARKLQNFAKVHAQEGRERALEQLG